MWRRADSYSSDLALTYSICAGLGTAVTGMCSTISHMNIWHLNTLGDEVPDAQAAFYGSLRSRNSPRVVGRGLGTHISVLDWKAWFMGKRGSALTLCFKCCWACSLEKSVVTKNQKWLLSPTEFQFPSSTNLMGTVFPNRLRGGQKFLMATLVGASSGCVNARRNGFLVLAFLKARILVDKPAPDQCCSLLCFAVQWHC